MTALQVETLKESLDLRAHAREALVEFGTFGLQQLGEQALLQCATRPPGDCGQ
jgi:hypothetical protein